MVEDRGRAISVWGGAPWLLPQHRRQVLDLAVELQDLGFSRLWVSGGQGEGVADLFADLLAATTTLGVATGILSIWKATALEAAQAVADLEGSHPGRFLLGVGNSHAPLVQGGDRRYERPYSRTVAYLDALDAAPVPVPAASRVLAALGPRMLALAGDRTLGAHPYFVPAQHTAAAREALGPGPLLAPEVAVVVDPDLHRARATARAYAAMYLALPNYTQNLRRFGYDDHDLSGGGSDRLLDALIPCGDAAAVAEGLERHFAAGADEIAVQVLTADPAGAPRAQYAALAAALAPAGSGRAVGELQ